MPAPARLIELIKIFEANKDEYKSQSYKEFRLRKEFLDPLFECLGWDMSNSSGYAEAYKDVVHEDSLRIDGNSKAPDYSFRIGGTRKFFVEAKAPSVNIKTDISPAFQLRRYGWSAKLPLSILTDFEEFAVYDCRIRPKSTDRAAVARTIYFTYKDYIDKWDEMAAIFSKEAILKGSFDRYSIDTKRKRGTAEVDDSFLEEIERWRLEFAKNIATRNPRVTVRDLNSSVQRIIDRIVFLRIAEDRGIEPYGRLRDILKGAGVYKRLCSIFEQADARYNSGLFHFNQKEGNAETLDRISLGLKIDDTILRGILGGLYFPESPYEFSVLPSDILGQVYERFLGKEIRLKGRSAEIVEKPEVKKSGGVYYTPTHVVRRIVDQSLLSKLKGKTPTQLSGNDARLKDTTALSVLDPACGSGSFLIEAYQTLLDWHLIYYSNDGAEKYSNGSNPRLYATGDGTHRLTISEKRRILLTHIFGVDIDRQAVEVTKLSLLLKLLEGESKDEIARQMDMFNTRVLPDLAGNIKCGNSLISSDLFEHLNPSIFEDDELYRINVFNWEDEFATIFTGGGFDVVIGNPPYDVLEKDRLKASWPHETLKDYIATSGHYSAALQGKSNLFRFFTIKSLGLLKRGGHFGMIMPMALLADTTSSGTRAEIMKLAEEFSVECFPQKDNSSRRIFKGAKLSTAVYHLVKGNKTKSIQLKIFPWDSYQDEPKSLTVDSKKLGLIDRKSRPVPVCDQKSYEICLEIYSRSNICQFSDISALEIRRGEINQTTYKSFITNNKRQNRLLKGVQVGAYELYSEVSQGQIQWFDRESYIAAGKRPKPNGTNKRIATQRITGVDDSIRIVATIVDADWYFADSTNSIFFSNKTRYALEYVLALLNSDLMQWRYKLTSSNNNVATNQLDALPFRKIDFAVSSDAEAHDNISSLVARIIELKIKANAGSIDPVLARRELQAHYKKINASIFSLYGISSEAANYITNSVHSN